MTRHKALHTGLVSPSPLDRWINAMLRGLAMLMSNAVRLCSMRLIRPAPECHSEATPEALPCEESGKFKETPQAATDSPTPRTSASSSTALAASDNNNNNNKAGLMLRTIAPAIVDSKHGEQGRRPARFGPVDQIEEPTPRQGQGLAALSTTGKPTALSTSHPRATAVAFFTRFGPPDQIAPCGVVTKYPEDLGCCSRGTLTYPHDLPTEILGMRFAYPRMTRGWVCEETHGQRT